MVIVKNKEKETDEVRLSSSTKVGRANSKDLKKAQKKRAAPFAGESSANLAHLKSDGTMMAPQAKKNKKKSKSIFSMIKNEKKQRK